LQNENISLKKEIERLRLENKSLSETVNYRDEELNEVKTQNNELREDINKVKGIFSKY
jgi:predicted nuclease with TOPRIM domain